MAIAAKKHLSDTREDGILLRSGRSEVEFIEFAVGEETFGADIAKVQRVIQRTSWTEFERIDNALNYAGHSSYVTGTSGIEGRVVMVPDLGNLMLKTRHEGGHTQVGAFEHGRAAWDYMESTKAEASEERKSILDYIDCIITDIEMPQMDGLTLCRSIKEATAGGHIPSAVVYSSLVKLEMEVKGKPVGADAKISKPHGDEILQLIDDLCM